jgi:FtsP/CotA-like multicopper oxidase with cupredoxin domain
MPLPEESEQNNAPDFVTADAPTTEPPVETQYLSGMSDSQPGTGEEANEAEDEQDEDLPEFDPQWQEDFNGLLFLGSLSKTFDYMGHRFTIRTLNGGEILAVAQVTAPYAGTIAENRAYTMATVAATVVAVDGQPLPLPFEKITPTAALQQRFERVKDWFPPTIDYVFGEYLALNGKVEEVLAKMGEAFG